MATNASISSDTHTVEKPRLLLIDDDHLIVESLSFVLQEVFEVLTASTRDDARVLLQKLTDQPSLALVDLGLPPTPHTPEEGFTLITELLAFNPTMKFWFYLGKASASIFSMQ